MSDLLRLAEGFLEGFTGGGLFVRSRRSDAPTAVFAAKPAPKALALIEELDAIMVEPNSAEYTLLRSKVGDEDVAALRHTLARFRTAVTSGPIK